MYNEVHLTYHNFITSSSSASFYACSTIVQTSEAEAQQVQVQSPRFRHGTAFVFLCLLVVIL